MKKVTAPWDEEQVRSLNAYQRSGFWHPFTCATEHPELGEMLLLASPWGLGLRARRLRLRAGLGVGLHARLDLEGPQMTEREKDELLHQLLRLNLSYATVLKIWLSRVEER